MSACANNLNNNRRTVSTNHIISAQQSFPAQRKEDHFMLKELDRAAEVAAFYGFTPMKTPNISREDVTRAIPFKIRQEYKWSSRLDNHLFPQPEEKICVLRHYEQYGMPSKPHPIMLFYKKPFDGFPKRHTRDDYQFGLDIIGTSSSVAEALLIKTTLSILSDQGHDGLCVEINTVGDRDSIYWFERELAFFCRRNLHLASAEFRMVFKKDYMELFHCTDEKNREFKEAAPKPMAHLSEQSIEHFKEVLEYMETLGIPYKIKDDLVGHRHFCSGTIFEIRKNDESEDTLFAIGARHDYITKKIGFKRDMPIISLSASFKVPTDFHGKISKRRVNPKFYFIQFGQKAKLKCLHVIETLRKAKVPVLHSITKDKFDEQLVAAENMNTPYIIIMGQKEAIDDTVVVRNQFSRAQETVSIAELPVYIAKLK